ASLVIARAGRENGLTAAIRFAAAGVMRFPAFALRTFFMNPLIELPPSCQWPCCGQYHRLRHSHLGRPEAGRGRYRPSCSWRGEIQPGCATSTFDCWTLLYSPMARV